MNKQIVISKLPPFEGREIKLVNQQTVEDIIPELIKAHNEHRNDYDKISYLFVGKTPRDTMRNCWNFLKKNVVYRIEGVNRQRLCSPGAIMALGNVGLDCKNYALFIAGICESLNRLKIQNFPFCFRFASYKLFDKIPQHVFVVAYPETKNEIWCDPVLTAFDFKKNYTYKIDKNPMALYKISGVSQQIGVLKFAKKIGGAPTRGAFLALVSLNAFGLAKKLGEAYDTNKNELLSWWKSQGGMRTPLERAIRKGRKKRRLFGIDDDVVGVIYDELEFAYEPTRQIGVAPAVLAAKAARIIKSFAKFFKRLKQLKKIKKIQQIAKRTQKIRSVASRVKAAATSVKELAESAPINKNN